MGLTEGLSALKSIKTFFPAGNRFLGHSAVAQSLCQLSCFGSPKINYANHMCYKKNRRIVGPICRRKNWFRPPL